MRPCEGYVERRVHPEPGAVSSYENGCRHGFPVTPVCWGANSDVPPHCCREEWCGWFYEKWGGKPPMLGAALSQEEKP